MKFENTSVFNFEGAFRGMRNPLESWEKSDSKFDGRIEIGDKDIELAQRLIKSGSEHRKFMRQIMISVDITAPLYWWKEFDTYKVGTVANSTSTMHKLATTPIDMSCFEFDDYARVIIDGIDVNEIWIYLIRKLEKLRLKHLETKDKKYWKELIRLLPESWLQTRTITLNYENVHSMIKQRNNHKLTEWHTFIQWAKELPYAKELFV